MPKKLTKTQNRIREALAKAGPDGIPRDEAKEIASAHQFSITPGVVLYANRWYLESEWNRLLPAERHRRIHEWIEDLEAEIVHRALGDDGRHTDVEIRGAN